ncbi:MAG: hypothetical protein JXR25_10735 [Pontiellaceae bacterium]|nr:hypothetical protein [Pontiellaceae bacterium]
MRPNDSSLFPLSIFLFTALSSFSVGDEAQDGPSSESSVPVMDIADPNASIVSGYEQGRSAFYTSCTQCHDAERATGITKSYEGWLSTVRRMSEMNGANVRERDIEPIAEYLAERSLQLTTEPSVDAGEVVFEVLSDTKLSGAVSVLWRDSDAISENNGFLVDVWVGAEWKPANSPVSLTVMSCTSCHSSGAGLELVEGRFTADLIHLVSGKGPAERESDFRAAVSAGRIRVPFGAFSETVHPGTYKSMTYPLMYNMDRRVGAEEFMAPVLPMPYSDEGIDFYAKAPLPGGLFAGFNLYGINGLQSDFYSSREYDDNNSDTTLGCRATLGNSWFRIGGSYAEGEMQFDSFGDPQKEYQLIGGDVSLRYRDLIRLNYEYAIRKEDTEGFADGDIDGHVLEAEGRIWQEPRISLVVRYDTLERNGALGDSFTERISWGPTIALGGTVLLFNHEHWEFDTPDQAEDVLGFRWVAWF